MSDIVERLRELRKAHFVSGCGDYNTITGGMVVIEHLRAELDHARKRAANLEDILRRLNEENERLEEALRSVLTMMQAGSTISSEVRVIRLIEEALHG